MVWIDIVLIVIILWFAYKGLRNGLVVELTSFVSLILAVWAALKYGSFTRELLQNQLGMQGDYLPFLSFVITFLLVLIIVGLIGRLITKALNVAQLGILNKLLGVFFAVLKIGIILSLVVNGLNRVNKTAQFISQETINNSYLYQPLNAFSQKIYKFSDEHFDEVKDRFNETMEDLEPSSEA